MKSEGGEPISHLTVSEANEALIFMILRLISRLSQMEPSPPNTLMRYGAKVQSFRGLPPSAGFCVEEENEPVIPMDVWRWPRK
jgi:hypothetical protein